MIHVTNLMTRTVASCAPSDALQRAAQLMWDHDCGCLPVCEDTRVVGVITDRDICMAALFNGKPLHELRVSNVMSRQLQLCRAGDTVAEAEGRMSRAQVRRLPVVDDQGSLIGMITLADLARQAANENTHPTRQVTESEINDTLAAVCQPRPEKAD